MSTEVALKPKDLGMWVICCAIGKQTELISQMEKRNVDGVTFTDVTLTVGGVELDFNNVLSEMQEQFAIQMTRIEASVGKQVFEQRVSDKVTEIIKEKYAKLFNELDDIETRLDSHKEVFKYEWE